MPEGGQWPVRVVVTCEHAGNRVPARYRSLLSGPAAERALRSHRGWDPGALPVALALAHALSAALVESRTTRLLVDLNRSLSNPSVFSEWSSRLDAQARREVLAAHYTPHRDAVRRLVGPPGAMVVHLGIHSFTPRLRGETRRAEIGLLYDPRRVREQAFCALLARSIRGVQPGWVIRRNYPYRGVSDGLTTSLRKELPADAYLGVEIELNQALFGPRAARDGPEPALARAVARSLIDAIERTLSAWRVPVS